MHLYNLAARQWCMIVCLNWYSVLSNTQGGSSTFKVRGLKLSSRSLKQGVWVVQPPDLVIATLQNFFIHLTVATTFTMCSTINELGEYNLSRLTAVIEYLTVFYQSILFVLIWVVGHRKHLCGAEPIMPLVVTVCKSIKYWYKSAGLSPSSKIVGTPLAPLLLRIHLCNTIVSVKYE